jgi:hypothetical protein
MKSAPGFMGRWSGATDTGYRVFEVRESPEAHQAWLDGTAKPSLGGRIAAALRYRPPDSAEKARRERRASSACHDTRAGVQNTQLRSTAKDDG